MKILISNYSFNSSTGVITFNDYTSTTFKIENLLLITNISYNTVIYNFADPSFGGIKVNNSVDLFYNTTSMSSLDPLQIWYDDGISSNELTDESNEILRSILTQASILGAVRGTLADLRVTPLSTPNMSALTTLSNLAGLSGWGTGPLVKDFDNLTAINSNINNVG
jgi:hypothetical protein